MPKNKPTIHIGADHRGYCLKYDIKKYLSQKGYEVIDYGNYRYQDQDDYPEYAKKVSQAVAQDIKNSFGILICGSGIGMDIAANKTKCIRAALCWQPQVAVAARNDDNPHILILPADFITKSEAKKTVNKFINTPFSGKTKNQRRLKQIKSYEKCQK
ncbi:MAG: RpiB/LacA/LacB family sugar-phosphate isomerase [Patescibacteria group bacterium]